MPTSRTDRKWEVVVVGVIAVIALLVALIIGLTITDNEPGHATSTPLISMLVALVPVTIASLLALLRTNDNRAATEENRVIAEDAREQVTATKRAVEKTQKDLSNGVLTANMRAAIRAVAHEDSVSIEASPHTPPPPGQVPRALIDPQDGEIPGGPGTEGLREP